MSMPYSSWSNEKLLIEMTLESLFIQDTFRSDRFSVIRNCRKKLNLYHNLVYIAFKRLFGLWHIMRFTLETLCYCPKLEPPTPNDNDAMMSSKSVKT